MRNRGPLDVTFFLTWLCPQLLAQSAPTSPGLQPAERTAFRAKEDGRYAEARDAFLSLLLGSGTDARDAALHSFWAVLAHNVGRRVQDFEPLRSGLLRAEASPLAAAHPTYRDQLRLLLLDLALATGDLATAQQRTQDLGFVPAWRCIGPFDNERGAAFARALPPEKGIDLRASYDGKKRPVQWRRQPVVPAPGAKVDLGAMLRPANQIAAYAAVVLRAERECDAVLHLGCDGASKVFVAGREVHARDVRRAFAYDQDAIPLRLGAGANPLVIKLCVQDGGAAFAARLTARDGSPLQGVTCGVEDADFAAPAATAAAEKPTDALDLGARSWFARTAQRDGADAFRLAYLLALRQPDDPNERQDHALAGFAAKELPDFLPARFLLAYTRIKPVLHDAEKEENPRREDYAAILAKEPDHPETLRALAEMDLDGVGAAETAERALRKALQRNPDFVAARLVLARALENLRQPALARREVLRATTGSGSFEALRALAESADREQDVHAARAAYERALACELRPETMEAAARVLARVGAATEAQALLTRGSQVFPFHAGLRSLLAAMLEGQGQHDKAAAAWRAWLEICPEDDGAWLAIARLAGLQGNREAKLAALRQAIDLNPNLKDQRRYLEFLEAEAVPFYKPYEFSGDAILKADPGAAQDAATANDPFYYLANQRVVHAYRNGTTSEYRHFLVRILTEDGRRQWNSWALPYWRGEQRARLLDVRIVKKDGSSRKPKLKGERVELAGLEIGDTIEIRSRTDDLAPGFFGDYFGLEHVFVPYDGTPSRNSELVLVLAKGREYRTQQKNGVPEPEVSEDKEGNQVRRWRLPEVPRRSHEEAMPRGAEHEPLVRVTTYRDWDHFASWWWNLVKNQLEVTPAMREKVAALTTGKADLEQKIAAVYGFVTTEINYQAWEFGVHGYKPYSTPAIFERRHGDCKDKALLLCALLGELGVEAYPVLIEADLPHSRDDLELPLISHFNHCIAYMPEQKGLPARFLDGTATWHPLGTVPEMDLGATVLVVRGAKGEVKEITYPSAELTLDRRELTIDVRENGDATLHLRRRPFLTKAVPVREELGNEPEKRKENLERELGSELGKVTVKELAAGEPQDLTKPVELDATVEVKEFAQRDGDRLVLKAALRGSPLPNLVQKDKREHALLLGAPESEIDVLRYRIPDGYEPVSVPAPVKIDGRAFTYTLTFALENGVLEVNRRVVQKSPRVEPAEYPELKEAVLQAEQADRQVVVLKKKGSR